MVDFGSEQSFHRAAKSKTMNHLSVAPRAMQACAGTLAIGASVP